MITAGKVTFALGVASRLCGVVLTNMIGAGFPKEAATEILYDAITMGCKEAIEEE